METDIFDIFLFWLYLGKSATFILLLVFHRDAFPEKISKIDVVDNQGGDAINEESDEAH